MEPARSTLYRSFLLTATTALFFLGIGFRMVSFLIVAAVWTLILALAWTLARRGLAGVKARRVLYPSAFEGDEVSVDLLLESDRPVGMIEVADKFGPSIADEHRMLEPCPLEPDAVRRLSYLSWCSRNWGLHTVGPLRLTTADPWGLWRSERLLPLVEEFALFPRVYDVSGLWNLGSRPTLAPHEAAMGRAGSSRLYLGVRDYRAGDDPRHIHWPASARRGVLVVKEYEVDLAPYFTVFIDLDKQYRGGTGRKSVLEYVVRTAASIVWSAAREGNFVQLIGEGRKPVFVPPGRGQDHLTFALYELVRAVQDGEAPLHDVILHHLPAVPERSTVTLVSGTAYVDLAAIDELLEVFRGRGVRLAVVLVNNFSFPAIHGWPPPRAEVQERCREVSFFLQSRGVPVRILEETMDLEAVLLQADFST